MGKLQTVVAGDSQDMDILDEIRELRRDIREWRKECGLHNERTTRVEERQNTIRETLANAKKGRLAIVATVLATALGLATTSYWREHDFKKELMNELAALKLKVASTPLPSANP